MFTRKFSDELVLHFHRHPQFIGSFYEGIAVFSQSGQLLAANRSALLQLGIDRYQLQEMNFSSLFDLPLERIWMDQVQRRQPLSKAHNHQGQSFFLRLRLQKPSKITLSSPGMLAKPRAPTNSASGITDKSLDKLSLGDPQMDRILDQARRVLGHDIPILLEGESGTGKELLARALHQSGPRKKGPFVPINCAAIPAGLIESELFGYHEGAFTGARRKGASGKIRQADGGTLFLDEIGDMPLELQARLLRVLQERSVAPLGESQEQPVDIAVIYATNRKIRQEVQAGRFREDLYYRLNGLVLPLPPLRLRSDRLALAEALLAEMLPADRRLNYSRQVRSLFQCHPWPGNIRQLSNLLRTALTLLGESETELAIDHLQADFLEQAQLAEETALVHRTEPYDAPARLGDLKQQAVQQAIEDAQGNLSAAARRLGIGRTTLYRKLNQYKAGNRCRAVGGKDGI